MTGPVVPVAAIEAFAFDLRRLAAHRADEPGSQVLGAVAELVDALVAEHQTSAEGDCCQMHGQREPYPTPESGTQEPGCSCPVADSAPKVRLTDEERASLPEYARDVLVWRAVEAIVASRTEPLRAEVERMRDYADHTSCVESYTALMAERDQARAERDEWMERVRGTSVAMIQDATAQITAERDQARADLAALRERVEETVGETVEPWPFGTDAACQLIAAAGWPNERVEDRDGWAVTMPKRPWLFSVEVERARERLEQAIAHVAVALGGEG